MSKNREIMLTKIATATLGLSKMVVRKIVEAGKTGESVPLYTVGGVVRKVETGTSGMGDYTRFIGEFYANLDCSFEGSEPASSIFRSNKCFVPSIFEAALENKVLAQTNEKGKVEAVEFAIQVSAKADEKAAAGYVFTVEALVKLSSSSEIDNVRAKAEAAKKANK